MGIGILRPSHIKIYMGVVQLCRCGYDVNATDSCGISPLMDAIRGNHLNATQFLLKCGVCSCNFNLINVKLLLGGFISRCTRSLMYTSWCTGLLCTSTRLHNY